MSPLDAEALLAIAGRLRGAADFLERLAHERGEWESVHDAQTPERPYPSSEVLDAIARLRRRE